MISEDMECPFDLPEHTFEGLKRYAVERRSVGDFLTAVLENNLVKAVGHADPMNEKALRRIVQFVYCDMPVDCWGTPAKVHAWSHPEEEEKTSEHTF